MGLSGLQVDEVPKMRHVEEVDVPSLRPRILAAYVVDHLRTTRMISFDR